MLNFPEEGKISETYGFWITKSRVGDQGKQKRRSWGCTNNEKRFSVGFLSKCRGPPTLWSCRKSLDPYQSQRFAPRLFSAIRLTTKRSPLPLGSCRLRQKRKRFPRWEWDGGVSGISQGTMTTYNSILRGDLSTTHSHPSSSIREGVGS